MDITVNGEARRMTGPLTVAGLLSALALEPRKIAVERNLEIVPKSRSLTATASKSSSSWAGVEECLTFWKSPAASSIRA